MRSAYSTFCAHFVNRASRLTQPNFLFAFISRDFKQEQLQIRLNLVVALAAAQLGFLSGIDALEPKVWLLDCLFWHKQVFFSLFVVFFLFCFVFLWCCCCSFLKIYLNTPLENDNKIKWTDQNAKSTRAARVTRGKKSEQVTIWGENCKTISWLKVFGYPKKIT